LDEILNLRERTEILDMPEILEKLESPDKLLLPQILVFQGKG